MESLLDMPIATQKRLGHLERMPEELVTITIVISSNQHACTHLQDR
jgi:hypothetical protein